MVPVAQLGTLANALGVGVAVSPQAANISATTAGPKPYLSIQLSIA
jgi:hypothetical protein